MAAAYLRAALGALIGRQNIFMDVDSVKPGEDFVEKMLAGVTAADVVLVVIGKNWLNATGADERRRIDDPEDYVRLEVEAALELGKRVIPVLVSGAEMPRANALPASVAPLTRRNGLTLGHTTFDADIDRIAGAVGVPPQ
ncbi:toll/interleukin-1 receptor domain-containing protein [Cryptosporangium phraense]|uniref:Toll/interleukin-1 receptor domain-containing protein n=2 Tax=Cryptosporangium phraense TaxID=2593070 RepID=A0A545AIY8_9ACTN|nr:toll/interleukin-1 receptor domain-containing protein [Cryptosporangium phraense]